MQYKIPQNVGIEDKIVGPLTLRQLIMIAVGTGISYTLFAIASKLYQINTLEYVIIAIPAVLSVAFALIKINDVPLLRYILLFMEFSIKPKKRIWDHRGIAHLVSPDIDEKMADKTSDENSTLNMQSKNATNLEELTRMLDSGGFDHLKNIEHDDLDVTQDENLVTQAYFGHKKGKSKTDNMYWRTLDAHKEMLDVFAKVSVTQIKEGTEEANIIKEQVQKVKKGVEKMKQKKDVQKPKTIKDQSPTQDKTASKKPVSNEAKTIEATDDSPKKKRRRRRKTSQPVRTDNHVNTTNKNKPASYIPKATSNKTKAPVQKDVNPSDKKNKPEKNKGEFDLRELGQDIEINLD